MQRTAEESVGGRIPSRYPDHEFDFKPRHYENPQARLSRILTRSRGPLKAGARYGSAVTTPSLDVPPLLKSGGEFYSRDLAGAGPHDVANAPGGAVCFVGAVREPPTWTIALAGGSRSAPISAPTIPSANRVVSRGIPGAAREETRTTKSVVLATYSCPLAGPPTFPHIGYRRICR